ncbi:MAG: helix-turn-helix domain-containing protein, partial [Deltaproteobacteria bacterium]|nr:helix-turn-helix domain-containing protein [Deltaproteobacteria bacterium]
TEVPLTPIEFCLLRELVLAAGRVLSRDALLDRVRGRNFEAFDRSIDVHVSHLRQKLGDDPVHPQFIKTVRGVGYQFLKQPSE